MTEKIKTINRLLINICSDKLPESRNFYTKLFDFEVSYDSDWFIHLVSKDKQFELGIIDRTNELVPEDYQKSPEGFYITIVVDSADAIYESALEYNVGIIQAPKDTIYGQRRLLLKDPNGTMIDVSSPIENFVFKS